MMMRFLAMALIVLSTVSCGLRAPLDVPPPPPGEEPVDLRLG